MKKLSVITSAYKSEKYLETYLKNIIEQEGFEDFIVILILNDPNEKEINIANHYKNLFPENIQITQVKRESIGSSVNRGFAIAETEFVTYADVDDYKKIDCYIRQLKTLQDNPEKDFTYGDFITVSGQGVFNGVKIKVPKFNKEEATRSSIVGPNHFFRKKILKKCGYWDEQFKSGGDFDFQIRAAFNTDFVKTDGEPLLYYTRYEGSGSASSNDLQKIERTVIELRYGIYDKINYKYLPEALKYDIFHVYYGGQKRHISELVPNYNEIMNARYKKYFKKGIRRNYINTEILERIKLGIKYLFKNPIWLIKKLLT